ncbi:MAG: glycosyltransferase family A protein [Pseudomonadota bacterium]
MIECPPVTVVIPTFRRTTGLTRAVESVFSQSKLKHCNVKVLIVDNDPDGSALDVAAGLAIRAPKRLDMKIVHEPKPGVANARNTAIHHVDTNLIAFLDDDQTAPERWLDALIATHQRHPSAVVFGPVVTALPEKIRAHRRYLKRFFARTLEAEDGPIDRFFGCGNALIDLSRVPLKRPLFDISRNETGGEDDLLFQTIEKEGGGFAWSPCARVFEHVPPSRAKLSYTLQRAVSYGAGPSNLAQSGGENRWLKTAFWMAVGAGQVGIFGAASVCAFILQLENRAEWYDRAAQGLGKIFWWKHRGFYGADSPEFKSPAPRACDTSADGTAPLGA